MSMSKRKIKKNKIDLAYSELRVYRDEKRPAVFSDKRRSEKYKNNWKNEIQRYK